MNAPTRIRIGSWVATPALNLLQNGEQSVKLEARTMDVLAYLAGRAGEVVSVEELLASVWQGVVVGESSVYQAIKQLRQAFGPNDGAGYIETIPKRGYRLTAPVEALAPEAVAPASEGLSPAERAQSYGGVMRWPAAAAAFAVVAVVAALAGRWSAAPPAVDAVAPIATRFAIPAPDLLPGPLSVAVSPDGRHLAYVAGDSPERAQLYVRARDAFEARALLGTEGATMPFWSPDGQEIGFRAGSELKRVALVGGAPRRIADIGAAPRGTATWNASGDILFDSGSGLKRVSAAGGVPVEQTSLEAGEGVHTLPEFLPDGRHFLLTSGFRDRPGIFVASLDDDRRVPILPIAGMAAYASGQLLVNHFDGALTAQPFDLDRLALTGEPVRLAEDVAGFSVSTNGVLAYTVGLAALFRPTTAPTQLVWYDRAGLRLGTTGQPGPYRGIVVSRDGRYVAVHRHEAADLGQIDVLDNVRQSFTRRTLNRADNVQPVWSPDGSRIIYTGPNFNLYQTPSSGDGPEQLVLDSLRFAFASDWSADGKTVLVMHTPLTSAQLDVAALAIDDGTVTPVLTSQYNEAGARFSPDGRWIAYNSDESGRYEVYVREYPRGEIETRISTDGGLSPRWSRDGRELFYVTRDGTLKAVDVEARDRSFSAAPPHALFAADFAFDDHDSMLGQLYHAPYDVSLEGDRFLVNERIATATAEAARGTRAAEIAIVVDWTAELAP